MEVPSSELKVETSGKKIYDWKDHGLKLELPSETSASFDLKTVSSRNYELPAGRLQFQGYFGILCFSFQGLSSSVLCIQWRRKVNYKVR